MSRWIFQIFILLLQNKTSNLNINMNTGILKLYLAIMFFSFLNLTGQATTWTDPGNYDTSWYDDLSTSYYIHNAKALAGLAYYCNNGKTFANKTVHITDDIDMNSHEWVMITNFNGTINGNGHSISNLHYSYTTTNTGIYKAAFINELGNNATVINLNLENVNFNLTLEYGGAYAGGLACVNNGTISNCIITGKISANYEGSTSAVFDNYYSGGIVAYNFGKILNSSYEGDVESLPTYYSRYNDAYAGGITGYNEGEVINCINQGGFVYSRVGYNSSSWNSGGSFPSAYAGGICGASKGIISNVINLADVTAVSYKLGNMEGYKAYASGITALGECNYGYYSSSSAITGPSIINVGLLLSLQQMQNINFDFISLLNQNTNELSVAYDISWWANSTTTNNGIPFLLNVFAVKMQVSDIGQNTATFTATPVDINSSEIAKKGFEYKKEKETTWEKVYASGDFSCIVNNLESSENYSARAFITTTNGKLLHFNEVKFAASPISIETREAVNITATSATLRGYMQSGSTSIQSQGFLWKAESEASYHIVYAEGQDFKYKLENLTPNTMYNYQAFVLTKNGDNLYGKQINFSTQPITLTFNEHSIIDYNKIILNGRINADISTDVTIEYKKSTDNAYNKTVVNSNAKGMFECTLSSLLPNTYYNCRAYILENDTYIYSKIYTYKTLNVLVQTLTPLLEDFVLLRGEVLGASDMGKVGFEYRDVNYPDLIVSDFIYANLNSSSFTAKITNVENGKEYKYRAFYEEETGNRTYGEWVYFIPTNIVSSINSANSINNEKKIIRIYNVNGLILDNPIKGINIIKYSDGTTRKILIK